MSSQKCTEIADILVDFADGELAEAECNEVTAHLAECADCREELELLKRSLCLTKSVWREDAAAHGTTSGPLAVEPPDSVRSAAAASRRRVRRWAVAASVTACVLLGLLSSIVWPPRPSVSNNPPSKNVAKQSTDTRPPISQNEIDRLISRRVRCARLAVSVELLASQPGLEKYRDDARRYLAEVSKTGCPDPRPFSNGRTR